MFYVYECLENIYIVGTLKIYEILECLKGFIYAKEIL